MGELIGKIGRGVEHAAHIVTIEKIRPHAFIRVSRAEVSDLERRIALEGVGCKAV